MEEEGESDLPGPVLLQHLLQAGTVSNNICQAVPQHLDGDEVLEALGHLAAGDGEVAGVQEVTSPAVVVEVGLDGIVKCIDVVYCTVV